MKFFYIFLFVFICLDARSQQAILFDKPPVIPANQNQFPKKLLEEDMLFWQQQMEESHVNPYHAISREELVRLRTNILDGLPEMVNRTQAIFAVSKMISALNEGHLGLASDRISDSLYSFHSVRFPYFISHITHDGWYVRFDLSKERTLDSNARIIAINSIPVTQLYNRYREYFGGLEEWRKVQVRDNIRKLLFLDGIENPFQIRAVKGSDTLTLTATGYTREDTDSLNRELAKLLPSALPYEYKILDNNIGYLAFNSMNGRLRTAFSTFLHKTFTDIKSRPVKGLIIDLRNNGGGDSGLGDTLISYISNKPYRNAGGVKMKISAQAKELSALRKTRYPFENMKDGEIYEYRSPEPAPKNKNALQFEGPVCFLIGPGTFSSANMLTNAIKDYQLATLIGEPTAEPGNDYGEVFPFMLPNTGIIATGAMKMFIRANGDEKDYNGIQPDIYIRNSPEDIRAGRDKVLEAGKAWAGGRK